MIYLEARECKMMTCRSSLLKVAYFAGELKRGSVACRWSRLKALSFPLKVICESRKKLILLVGTESRCSTGGSRLDPLNFQPVPGKEAPKILEGLPAPILGEMEYLVALVSLLLVQTEEVAIPADLTHVMMSSMLASYHERLGLLYPQASVQSLYDLLSDESVSRNCFAQAERRDRSSVGVARQPWKASSACLSSSARRSIQRI